MPEVVHFSPIAGAAVALLLLVTGAAIVASLDAWMAARIAGRASQGALGAPLREAALLLRQDALSTERPDALLRVLAPGIYAALAALALSVVPLGARLALADVRTGIVLFGAAEALAMVAIFLHGWSANAHLALMGGYRFVALALSYELLSMFVLIAAALPAESLQVSAIVEAQAPLWNVIRQPLGLPLWIVVTLGVSFWGPLDLAGGRDLLGGTASEVSGRQRLLWETARRAMLWVFCGMGAAVFLGGWHGPVLPGWLWIAVKTLALATLTLWVGHRLGRLPAERAMSLAWTVLLPVSFLGLAIAGIEALF